MKQFFPYSYKIYTTSEEVKSLCISICYFLFFILGILTLRFYNTSREVNVKIILNKVYSIFVKTSVGNLILNISLIGVSLALYYYSFPYILRYFKFHRLRIHYYYYTGLSKDINLKYKFYNKLCDMLSYDTTYVYSRLVTLSNYLLYYLGLKKVSYRIFKSSYYSKSFNIITWEKQTPFETLFHGYLNTYEHKLHLHLLSIVFLYDLLCNNCILKNIYIIMPYIFLYELWVRYSKMIVFKNRMYDVVIHYFIHKPLLDVDDTFMTFDDRTFEKTYLQHIMINYVHNDFFDKEIMAAWQKVNREYNPVQLLEITLGYPFYYILPINILIYFISDLLNTL